MRNRIGSSVAQSPKNWRTITWVTPGCVRIQFFGHSSGPIQTSKLPSLSTSRSSLFRAAGDTRNDTHFTVPRVPTIRYVWTPSIRAT